MMLVPLTRGVFAVIDDADWQIVAPFTWYAAVNGPNIYAFSNVNGVKTGMHRLIMQTPDGMSTDHISGITLDNRRSNLRICTAKENARNRIKGRARSKKRDGSLSQYKGVTKFVYNGKKRTRVQWRAFIGGGREKSHLGVFATEIEAARAYDTAAKQYYGPFARLNFPEQQDTSPPGPLFL